MSTLPSMPLYVDDFEADTAHLSLEEDGAYNRILRLCWRSPQCQIPDEPDWIMRRLRVDLVTFNRLVAPLLDEFFSREKGMVWQKRQRQEYAYISAVVLRRKEAGAKGGKAKALRRKDIDPSKASVLLVAKSKQTPSKTLASTSTSTSTSTFKEESATHSSPKQVSRSFSDFWGPWPNKVSKTAAEKAWRKLSVPDQDQVILRMADWWTEWRTTHPSASPIHPATFLNGRRWDDQKALPMMNGFHADPPAMKIRPQPPKEYRDDTTH